MLVSSVSAVPASLRMRTDEESTQADTVMFPAPSSEMTFGVRSFPGPFEGFRVEFFECGFG